MIKFKKGDTIIEVTMAISIFSMVAIAGVSLMNLGVATAQASLELVMAREAMDSQAEALRTIHNAYVASSGSPDTDLAKQWTAITSSTYVSGTLPPFGANSESCDAVLNASAKPKFVIDTRSSSLAVKGNSTISQAETFPRLVYGIAEDSNKIDTAVAYVGAKGVWVYVTPSVKDPTAKDTDNRYLAYDFHIRTCWNAPGKNVPTTLGTIIRLYSPNDTNASLSGDEIAECVNIADATPIADSFGYTGGTQTYTTTAAGRYKLEVWGAQGGHYTTTTGVGGKGGYSVGTVSLAANTTLYINVGGQATSITGGYNGGGKGCSKFSQYTNGGGGATDIKVSSSTNNGRIIVAGGGGGGHSNGTAGVGGGTTGGNGVSGNAGSGASQTAIGSGYASNSAQIPAGFGFGGSNTDDGTCSGSWSGGGGGWYGGGLGAPAGGGSGWVYTVASAGNAPSGWLLNSTYYLSDAQTIAGNLAFPAPAGGNETGHTGNGYARITWVGP